jgi:hypothetical protein
MNSSPSSVHRGTYSELSAEYQASNIYIDPPHRLLFCSTKLLLPQFYQSCLFVPSSALRSPSVSPVPSARHPPSAAPPQPRSPTSKAVHHLHAHALPHLPTSTSTVRPRYSTQWPATVNKSSSARARTIGVRASKTKRQEAGSLYAD